VKRLTAIASLILALAGLMGLSYKVYALTDRVNQTYSWMTEERYDRTMERIRRIERRCGRDAVRCDRADKEDVRRWKRQLQRLEKELGY